MNRKEQNALLHEVLADQAVDRLRTESLTAMLRFGRRRRFLRRTAIVFGILCVGVAGWWGAGQFSREAEHVEQIAISEPSSSPATPVREPETPPTIERISDDELLALFPGKTVALIGPPGKQQLLVFEAKSKAL